MVIVDSARLSWVGSTRIATSNVAAVVDMNGGCWVSSRSRRPRTGIDVCRRGWPGSARSNGSGSRAPAPMGPASPATSSRASVVVIEVDRPNRQKRRQHGKSDQLDAVEAARGALSGRCEGRAKSGDGTPKRCGRCWSRNDRRVRHGSARSSSCAI